MRINIKILKILYQNDLSKIITAVFSQGLLSISNFAIGILIARYAAKTEYGMYVILFSFIGILGAYQNAIINAPLIVLANTKNENEKRTYISSLAVGKNYLLIPPAFLLLMANTLYGAIIHSSRFYIIQGFVLFVVAIIYFSKEFIRTVYFLTMNTNAIFRMDILNVTTVLVGMILLVYYNVVSSLTGILVLGFGYFVAYIFAKRKDRYCSSNHNKSIKKALMENWNYGKWLLLGVTSSLLQDRGYIYIVSALLGLGTLAEISAARLFLMPIGILSLSSGNIAVAKGSNLLSLNKNNEYREFIFSFIFVLLIIWFFYFLLIMLSSNIIVEFLGKKYVNTQDLILLWGVFFFIYTIRTLLGTALVVYKQFDKQARFDIWGSTLAITSCFVLVFIIGRSGAVISLMIGEFVTMILYLKLYLSLGKVEVTEEIVLSK